MISTKGARLPVFDYSGKNIVGIKKYKKLVQDEISRIKNKPEGRSKWIEDPRPAGMIWTEDPIDVLKGVGKKKKEALVAIGIHRVNDIIGVHDDELFEEIQSNSSRTEDYVSLTFGFLKSLRDQARGASFGECPHQIINHLEAENPYLSRFGEDRWEEEIAKAGELSKHKCVTDLIHHMYNTTKEFYANTPYANCWMFQHDALTQMCDQDSLRWMEEKGILRHWLKPELGCNEKITWVKKDGQGNTIETKTSRNYANRPPGNRPELSPNDNTLNKDIRESLHMHEACTSRLPRDDPRRFSLATPKTISKAIFTLCDPDRGVTPTPDRIKQDILKVRDVSIPAIVKHGGKIVPGLADRNGHRNVGGVDRRRGPRTNDNRRKRAKTLEELGIHPVAIAVINEQFNETSDSFLQYVEDQTDEAMRRDEEDTSDDDEEHHSKCDSSESDSEGEDTE